jgi:transcriptional regulator with XRE-family HTH domain
MRTVARKPRSGKGTRRHTAERRQLDESADELSYDGSQLARVRLDRGLTHEQLAEETGIPAGALAAFEQMDPASMVESDVVPSINHVLRILHALRARLGEICWNVERFDERFTKVAIARGRESLAWDGRRFRAARIRSRLSLESAAKRGQVLEWDLEKLETGEDAMIPTYVPLRMLEVYHGPDAREKAASYLRRES